MKIKSGDRVQVIAGNNKSKEVHNVVTVLNGGEKLIVEGVNRVMKHVRRGHPKSPQGGRLQIELPINASNVQLYCGNCGKGTRTGYRYQDDGSKERFCKKCGGSQGQISPPNPKYAKS